MFVLMSNSWVISSLCPSSKNLQESPKLKLACRLKDVMRLDELPDIDDSLQDHLILEVNCFFVLLFTAILFPAFRLQKIDLLENMSSLNPIAVKHWIGFKSFFWLLSLGYPVLAI
jgi:hypothetical protein